jgi:hypothetical protein
LPAFRASDLAVQGTPRAVRRGTQAPSMCRAAACPMLGSAASAHLGSFRSSALRRSRPNPPWTRPIAAPNLKTGPKPNHGTWLLGTTPRTQAESMRMVRTPEVSACVRGVAPGSAAGRKPGSGAPGAEAFRPRGASAVARRARACEPNHAPNRLEVSEEPAMSPGPRLGTTLSAPVLGAPEDRLD